MKRTKKTKRTKIATWPEALNTHRKQHLCLTPKEVQVLVLALRSLEAVSSSELERAYVRKILHKIKEQTP